MSREPLSQRSGGSSGMIFHYALVIGGTLCAAVLHPSPALAASCTELGTSLMSLPLDNGATLVGPPAAQEITAGSYTPAGATAPITGLPPFCRVALNISSTGDANESQILIEVWLPESVWNGRYLGTGNGGFAGSINTSALAYGLRQGYATANTDLGTGVLYKCTSGICGGNVPYAGTPGGLYGHPDAIKDYGYRATHLMTVAAKQVSAAFYGQQPGHAYFAGCSTGGQQGLAEAQRFPADYEGILSGAPAYARSQGGLAFAWPYAWTHASTASQLTIPALSLINKSVLGQCGVKDGGAPGDGFLTQPAACRFDAQTLECTGAKDDVPCADPTAKSCTCLEPEQAAAMNAIWDGPVDDRGRQLEAGYLRGSETPVPVTPSSPFGNLGLVFQQAAPEPVFDAVLYWALGLNAKWQDLFADVSHPVAMSSKVLRSVAMAAVGEMTLAEALNATSDLNDFQSSNGKLILYQGWADPLITSFAAVDYWLALRRASPNSVSDFARLFMVPGMWHCSGGPGPNIFGAEAQAAPSPKPGDPSDDALAALTNWVEGGGAPDQIVATKYVNDAAAQGIALQRPLCRFPKHAAYNGTGNPGNVASFDCVPDENDRIVQPAPIYRP